MSQECNIEIGNCRFVQTTNWNDEVRIDIREWEMQNDARIPTRKGTSLPLQRWKLLVESFDPLDKALQEKGGYSSHIGENVYVNVKPNNVLSTSGNTGYRQTRRRWFRPRRESRLDLASMTN